MAQPFISYRRKPSASLALLIQAKLKSTHHIDAYVDTTRTDSNKLQFPDRLMTAIADAPVFICLLAETTLDSEWVTKENVGAHDMSGSIWEWASSLYLPYDSSEDREADTGSRTDIRRALRGCSWDFAADYQRAAARNAISPSIVSGGIGFRCVISLSNSDS